MNALLPQGVSETGTYGDARAGNRRRSKVLIRVRACGICGGDVHGFDGSTGRRIPPLVMGHEAAGEGNGGTGRERDKGCALATG